MEVVEQPKRAALTSEVVVTSPEVLDAEDEVALEDEAVVVEEEEEGDPP